MSDVTLAANGMSVFGDSPGDWTVDRIHNRLDPIVGGDWGDGPGTDGDGVEIPVIRVADIRGLDVSCTDLTIRRVKDSNLPIRLIGPRTLLIEKSGGGQQRPVGRAVLGRNVNGDAICSNFMAKTDCRYNLSPPFAAYVLDSAYSVGINTASIQQTTGIQNLRITEYLNHKYAFPPLPEQQRIAAYLDASCAAIEAAVAAKRRQIETLQALEKLTIHRAVTFGLDTGVETKPAKLPWVSTVPIHWVRKRIRDVAMLSPGYSHHAPAAKERCIVVPMDAVSGIGTIDKSTVQSFEEIPSGLTLFESGDVLFAKITPCMENGKGAFVEYLPARYAFGSTEFHVLRPSREVDGLFLYYFTFNPTFRDYAAENMSGAAGQKRVSTRFLKDTRLYLPPISEQRAIVAFLEDRKHHCQAMSSLLRRQIETLQQYRKSLIHECVTGQRRVTEADVWRACQTAPGSRESFPEALA